VGVRTTLDSQSHLRASVLDTDASESADRDQPVYNSVVQPVLQAATSSNPEMTVLSDLSPAALEQTKARPSSGTDPPSVKAGKHHDPTIAELMRVIAANEQLSERSLRALRGLEVGLSLHDICDGQSYALASEIRYATRRRLIAELGRHADTPFPPIAPLSCDPKEMLAASPLPPAGPGWWTRPQSEWPQIDQSSGVTL
jgi:hypothetical protein